jgi:ferrochelatase
MLKLWGMPLANHSRLLIVNFGGPRTLEEVPSFLKELLTDKDVIRSGFPQVIHNLIFGRVARKRAAQVAEDYKLIGGGSPIYGDTEAIATELSKRLQIETVTFHRYLSATHADFMEKMKQPASTLVFPLFPQFSYATTGSIARWFDQKLSPSVVEQMHWVRSYPTHPSYIDAFQEIIHSFLKLHHLRQEEVILLFSAHGLPLEFIETGDSYQKECEASYAALVAAFPEALCRLSYQSKFGRGEWIKPYTDDVCKEITTWNRGRKTVVIIPLSFTSDHIETLFEIEYQYVAEIRRQGLTALRCPALNLEPQWFSAIEDVLRTEHMSTTRSLFS